MMNKHNNLSHTELSKAERHKILVEWNNTQTDYPKDKCIHQLFEEQVERTPNAIAVVFEDQQLTYDELNLRANQLAHHLQSLGVSPEVLVGICVERSLEMVIGLLGILKAGGAYVPLDPTYPKKRLAFMLADAQVPVLLTQKRLVEDLPEHQAQIVCLETSEENLLEENPVSEVTPNNLVYVIYTSGSTGQPKGISVYHRGFTNLVNWFVTDFNLTATDSVLVISSEGFDLTQKNFFSPLIKGGQLHLLPASIRYDPSQITQIVAKQQITWLNCTPSAFYPLIESNKKQIFQKLISLRYIFLGGEPISLTRLWSWLQSTACQAKVINTYGPTECTDVCAAYLLDQPELFLDQAIPIGKPIFNAKLFILGKHFDVLPIGVAGELHIGGVGLARGYKGRPGLTAEKFIKNPFDDDPNSRLYKTGDLGRYLPDGNIEYLGRLDNQVKIRGFRIELGEIEAVLAKHPAVQQAVVIVWEVQQGDKRLVAYIVPHQKPAPKTSELHHFLKEQLPDYMVPEFFVMLETIPLTPNGKINRYALPTPDPFDRYIDEERVVPHTPIEEVLTTIWSEVFALEQIGIHDNFFALGGHSLLITQVIYRVRETLKVELSMHCLFDYPTITELAQHIEMIRWQKPNLQQAPAIQPISQYLPLSSNQEQLWFLAQLNPKVPFYNESATIHINNTLNAAALEQSVNEIIKRHEVLRTTFTTVDGQPVQKVMLPPTLKLPVVDLKAFPLEQREAKAQQLTTKEAKRFFDLTQGPLLRVTLVLLSEAKYRLFLTIHHIIIDGVSLAIFLKELAVLYQAFSTEKPSPLPELPIQYADFAYWQRQQLTAKIVDSLMSYWKTILGDNLPVLQLPTDQKRPVTPTFRGAKQYLALSNSLTEELKTLSQQEGVTLFMTLLAAFKTLLYRYSGQDDIVVGTVAAVRNRPEFEHLMGYFLNTFVLRTDLSGTPTFQKLLERVREVTLCAYAHNDLPFVTLVEALHTKLHIGQTPLFQVAFTLEPSMPNIDLGWTLTQSDIDNGTAKFDLYLGLEEKPEGLIGRIEYSTDLFEAPTISRMIGHFQTLLEGIVANPGQRISEISLLMERERHQLVQWNDTQRDYPFDKCIPQLFEVQVEQTPNAVAVVFEVQQMTYRELNAKANQLAHYLQTLGVKPEVLVGICVERSIEMVIGLLGIIKAGGAYLPLDPDYPEARLAFMLEDSQVSVLLTQSSLKEELPETKAQRVCLDVEAKTLSQFAEENVVSGVGSENLAYVIYTSGSTGKPKGVMIEYKGLVNLALEQISTFRISSKSRVLQFASFSFDASVSEITTTLLTGATLYLVPKAKFLEPAYLTTLMVQQQISHITLPPSFLSHLSDQALSLLQTLVVAGEACPTKWVKQWANKVRFINAYGPTESTVCASMALCFSEMGTPHIGQPIANTRIYILDAVHQPQPLGIPGELCIAGTGLARAYLNRPELTKEKFIEVELFGKTERIYKTGDLARWLPDGNLEYLGRIDHQVKLRGFRIELGEIEAVLSQHPRISEAVVVHNPDKKCLNAYLTQRNRVELWPSIAEFYVYDDIVYHSMATHESRNRQYLAAFQRVLPGKTVVEIGPGPEVILSRLALQAGAKKIYAIELLEDSYRKAQDTLKRLSLSDKIILIHGDATLVTLPESVDYCISEIVGSIGGSEGAAVIINNARRFLKDSQQMIPQRSVTKISAVSLPESLFDYGFVDIAAHYTQQIFEQVGYFFDLRLCVKNLPLTQLISNSDVFEDLDYRYPINLENRHEIELQFNKNSRFTGLLVWLTLHTDTEHMVDILTEQSSWLPVYLPLFIDGKSVKTGDRLVATITRQLCDNHFNPDYLLEGALYRQGQPTLPIHYHSYHFKPHYRVHPFYQKLFADDKVPVLPKLDAKMFRDYLSQYLPDYMVPSTFTVLDRLPLTPNGKIDRKALPALDSNTPTENTLPRDSIELQLLCMWETVLDRQKIGIHDNFFELGGHSLLAIRLMAEIQQQFGQNLSLASLFQGATIEQLAKIIRQQTDSQSWSPLVAIQPHGSKPPFFCMPGSGGNVIYFHQLARHLGTEQPFYALQARGLDGESAPLTCVEDIADYYLEAIRTVQPQGPYLLGGHSFGAIVAFEMAQRLHRQGKKVALLALLDLPALLPDRQPIELDWDDTKWMATIAHVLESLSGKTLGLSSEDFQALDADAQLTLLSASLERVNLLPVDAGINTVRGIAQVIKADELAFLRYVPPTGYSNQITLFKTGDVYQDELGMLNEEIPNDPAWGWGRLSTEPVEVIMVPGNHTTVLTEPHVQVLAEKLRECLDKV